MAVVAMREIWPGRGGDSEGADATTAVRRFRITTNNKHDTEQHIKASGWLPERYSPLPENIFLTLRRISLENIRETPLVWEAELLYSSEPINQEREERESQPNPLLRPARRVWRTTQYRQAVEQDRDGKAVLNSAGDLPDPPPEKDASYWSVTIRKNVAVVPAFLVEYDNPINKSSITIGGLEVLALKGKLQDINIGEEQIENGYSFVELSYTIQFRKQGWKGSFPDNGLREKDPSDETKRIHILDDNEEPVTSPVLLDGAGSRLANPSPETAVIIEWDNYEEMEFSLLPGISD